MSARPVAAEVTALRELSVRAQRSHSGTYITCAHRNLNILRAPWHDDITGDEYSMTQCRSCSALLIARVDGVTERVSVRVMLPAEEAALDRSRMGAPLCAEASESNRECGACGTLQYDSAGQPTHRAGFHSFTTDSIGACA